MISEANGRRRERRDCIHYFTKLENLEGIVTLEINYIYFKKIHLFVRKIMNIIPICEQINENLKAKEERGEIIFTLFLHHRIIKMNKNK